MRQKREKYKDNKVIKENENRTAHASKKHKQTQERYMQMQRKQ